MYKKIVKGKLKRIIISIYPWRIKIMIKPDNNEIIIDANNLYSFFTKILQ